MSVTPLVNEPSQTYMYGESFETATTLSNVVRVNSTTRPGSMGSKVGQILVPKTTATTSGLNVTAVDTLNLSIPNGVETLTASAQIALSGSEKGDVRFQMILNTVLANGSDGPILYGDPYAFTSSSHNSYVTYQYQFKLPSEAMTVKDVRLRTVQNQTRKPEQYVLVDDVALSFQVPGERWLSRETFGQSSSYSAVTRVASPTTPSGASGSYVGRVAVPASGEVTTISAVNLPLPQNVKRLRLSAQYALSAPESGDTRMVMMINFARADGSLIPTVFGALRNLGSSDHTQFQSYSSWIDVPVDAVSMKDSRLRFTQNATGAVAQNAYIDEVRVSYSTADPASQMGSGNIFDNDTSDGAMNKLNALVEAGVDTIRIGVSPASYWSGGTTAATGQPINGIDDIMYQIAIRNLNAVISFAWSPDSSADIGSQDKWAEIGDSYMKRYGPNGTFWTQRGLTYNGSLIWAAFNEPSAWVEVVTDLTEQQLLRTQYHDALLGFAQGLRGATGGMNATVIPAGYRDINRVRDFTEAGFITAIVDLLNNGTLNGVDIHQYRTTDAGTRPVPLINGRTSIFNKGGMDMSAATLFNEVKRINGITANIRYYTTEFNVRWTDDLDAGKPITSYTEANEQESARRYLTAAWDHLTVLDKNGRRATDLALAYQLFNNNNDDYGLSYGEGPWDPRQRGSVYSSIGTLSDGLEFLTLDPYGTGVHTLKGNGEKMWVWQNVNGWTNQAGSSFTITDIPSGNSQIEVYTSDGLRQTVLANGASSITIDSLPTNQTLMFRSRFVASEGVSSWS